MSVLKGPAIEAFLRAPDRPLALIYGPDAGLVVERATALVDAVETGDDPFARLVLDGDALASAPERLAEEAYTMALFGGRRAIRVRATARNIMPALAPLLETPPRDALVVVEAGELRPGAPLRRAFESADAAAAIPCYSDDGRAITGLIDAEARRSDLDFSADARLALERLLGGDRLASRGELAKLALYCHDKGRVEAEDVAAVAGDASAFALDDLADATGLGDAAAADRLLARALAAGLAPATIAGALSRHFRQLGEARHRVDTGATADSAMRALRPPVFFKRQNAFRRQVSAWPGAAVSKALASVARSELEGRRRPELAEAMLGRCILRLCRTASRGTSRRAAG